MQKDALTRATCFGALFLVLMYVFAVSPFSLPDPGIPTVPPRAVSHQRAPPSLSRKWSLTATEAAQGAAEGKVAIIVVPKEDPRLETVVQNAIENLPLEWKVQIFNSPEITNHIVQQRVLAKYHRLGRVIFTPTINYSMSYYDFSELMKNVSFWEQVEGEQVLTIQTDSVLCSSSPHSIDDFLMYDWVGAPWKKWPHLLAGNGGLSLRRKSKMIETILRCHLTKPQVEDMWFAYCFRQLPILEPGYEVNLAPQQVSMNFAVETAYSEHPLGVHKPWAWLTRDEMNKLSEYCPELLSVAPKEPLGRDTSDEELVTPPWENPQ